MIDVRYEKIAVCKKTEIFLDKRVTLYYPSMVFELFIC